jgi:hypothetical protein
MARMNICIVWILELSLENIWRCPFAKHYIHASRPIVLDARISSAALQQISERDALRVARYADAKDRRTASKERLDVVVPVVISDRDLACASRKSSLSSELGFSMKTLARATAKILRRCSTDVQDLAAHFPESTADGQQCDSR